MCAMCTPHCPTYRIYKTESESPRGRIALMQALDKGEIQPTQRTIDHLNHCLSCQACERICPSMVPFDKLMDAARQRFVSNKHGVSHKLLLRLSKHQNGLDYYQQPISFVKKIRLVKLLPANSKIRSIIEQSQTTPVESFYPARTTKKGTVGLFKGCIGKTFDANTLIDGIRLLTQIGFDVHVPESQYCCGALYQHNGDIENANNLAKKNQQQFKQYELDAILYTASGCGSQIINSQFSAPVMDLVSFLLQHLPDSSLTFKPLHQHVVIHQGCRGKNGLKLEDINQQLIEYVAGIKIHSTQSASLCCGAGGSNQLNYPELANNLLSIKLNELKITQVEFLVSDNLACSLHFNTGIKNSGLNIEVIHPVTLLARQML
jgi:glycolate dehydrogenase iron-sulfur subunit